LRLPSEHYFVSVFLTASQEITTLLNRQFLLCLPKEF
jgi:hypothetical protein